MAKAAALLFASALGAGVTAAGADPTAPVPLRLIVQLAQPSTAPTLRDQAEIAGRASEVAGSPVAFGAVVSADRIALQMTCALADCDAALQRLREATSLFLTVERDERRRRHGTP